ncbi:hypothetical protein PLICRDRAFT_43796 [Plicaturopsis crispa FD-325 SS-3]|nr:hypothetical protein PLICRDRAFT_43796 [Plicaturopsis crispa FD-325 SS-3]
MSLPPTTYQPVRTFAECDALLTAPGMLHEVEQAVVDGQVVKVYKNIETSLREFWLSRVERFRDREYLIFEDERITFGQTHERVSDVANTLREVYNVHKGDRVAIAMRNFPEWVITFWAIVLLGGVPTCVNVWQTDVALRHCLVKTNCKVAVVDAERAAKLAPVLPALQAQTALAALIVARAHEPQKASAAGPWPGATPWADVFTGARAAGRGWALEPECALEDDGVIFFTSGTTSLPKAVLSTRRGFIQNMYSMWLLGLRNVLRNGNTLPPPDAAVNPPRVQLAVAPFFHVAGCTSILMTNTANGGKLVLMRKWEVDAGMKLIKKEGVTSAGGVPAITLDLMRSPIAGTPDALQFKNITMGAAPMPPSMPLEMKKAFPNALFVQLYGLTETNLNATGLAGEDQIAYPTSCGPALPICDLLIVDPTTNKIMKSGEIGEVWIRGSNIMRCYYNDPEATAQAITRDGWFKTGDLGLLDHQGFLYIKDRAKDMIIRGGENIHCVTVENALLSHSAVLEAAAIGVPDARLGELPAAVVRVKWSIGVGTTEAELVEWAARTLPAMVVPVMVIVQTEPIERNATGKIVKPPLRKKAKEEWERRQGLKAKAKL